MVNINLLPPEIKLKIKQAKQSANIFSICLVALILVVVIGFLLTGLKKDLLQPELDNVNQEIATQNSKVSSFSSLENEALFINDRAELTKQIDNQNPVWSQIIQDLINSVPTNVQFTSLTVDITKAPNFVLQGQTASEREAIKFKEKLENSTFFKDVAFKSSYTDQNAEEGSDQRLNFSLEFNLENKSLKTTSQKDTNE